MFARQLDRRSALLAGAHLGVGALVGFVAFFRISRADAAPDERVYRHCADLYLHGMFNCNLQHPLLVKEILAVGIGIGGDSVTTTRVVTGVVALATAVFLYLFVTECTDRYGGLLAATAWGLLPQVGLQGVSTLEAVRIDRFALLDPYVACFFALALWAGWRWLNTSRLVFAGVTGAACMAAACSKSPGILIAPVICLAPLIAHRHSARAVLREMSSGFFGAVCVFVASYGPLGFGLARHAIAEMFRFQLGHASNGTFLFVGGHLYTHAPWWADFGFAIAGLGVITAVVLAIAGIFGAGLAWRPGGYALAASASIVLFTGIYLHLSLPHYWIDWEPGVVAAAAIGLRSCWSRRWLVIFGAAMTGALGVAMVNTVVATASLATGPYQVAASKIHCSAPCVIAYGAPIGILGTYIDHVSLDRAPVRVAQGTVEVSAVANNRRIWITPKWIFIDTDYLQDIPTPDGALRSIAAQAASLGYLRIATPSPIELFERKPGLPIVSSPA